MYTCSWLVNGFVQKFPATIQYYMYLHVYVYNVPSGWKFSRV